MRGPKYLTLIISPEQVMYLLFYPRLAGWAGRPVCSRALLYTSLSLAHTGGSPLYWATIRSSKPLLSGQTFLKYRISYLISKYRISYRITQI